MTKNDGLGRVVEKNVLISDTLFYEGGDQALNKHANGIDWWLVVPRFDTNAFSIFLIDSTGINYHHEQTIGIADNRFSQATGQSMFSHFGDKYYRYWSSEGLQMMDFDRETGRLSNYEFVPMPPEHIENSFFLGGMGLSPNGRYAYLSGLLSLYQYDLAADDIAASRLLIAELTNPDSLWEPIRPAVFDFQLGPDCKLYSYTNTGFKHHIIHNPNERGEACEWEQNGLVLPFSFFRDQPTYPNYRLGPLGNEGSPCAKPLIVSGREPDSAPDVKVTVFPNPSNGPLRISAESLPVLSADWQLIDGLGRIVTSTHLNGGQRSSLVNTDGLTSGLYYWRLVGDGRILQQGKVVLQR